MDVGEACLRATAGECAQRKRGESNGEAHSSAQESLIAVSGVEADRRQFIDAAVHSKVDVYPSVFANMLPTPAKSSAQE